MTADSGPVLSGWLLGDQLTKARSAAGHSVADTAKELGVHSLTIRRWENAEVTPSLLSLRGLCAFLEVPSDQQAELERLRARAAEPGWWNGTGNWPDATAEMLGMEIAAIRIRAWDLAAIPGLLQTPEYARLIIQAVEPNNSPTIVDAGVKLRMARQERVLVDGPVREATFMLDELALARMPGGASVRRAQIARLLAPPEPVTVKIVPFTAGPHPALGSFFLCDFDSDIIRAGVFVEGSVTGRSRVETGEGVTRYEQVWSWLQTKALSAEETDTFLRSHLESVSDDDQQ
ncbi:helix-turn-helix transcriptional regulator [Spirillospora sp. NPDC047279]|uniref:helix-turn-helix domain-containing protein n=1 Tax=Spirillospora sp. NPDC047279 TaxID=3155478 RepID=UPI0033DD95A4